MQSRVRYSESSESSENSENSALDTIIVSHKIYEKKRLKHRFPFTSSDSPIKFLSGIPSIPKFKYIYIYYKDLDFILGILGIQYGIPVYQYTN